MQQRSEHSCRAESSVYRNDCKQLAAGVHDFEKLSTRGRCVGGRPLHLGADEGLGDGVADIRQQDAVTIKQKVFAIADVEVKALGE